MTVINLIQYQQARAIGVVINQLSKSDNPLYCPSTGNIYKLWATADQHFMQFFCLGIYMFNQFLITIADVNGYDVRAFRDMYDTSLSCYAALISKKSFFST